MKRIIMLLAVLVIPIIFSMNVYGETAFNVTINYLDSEGATIKDATVETYNSNDDVTINISDLNIEGYEIESIECSENVTKTEETLMIADISADASISVKYVKLNTYKVIHLLEGNKTAVYDQEIKYARAGDVIPKESDIVTIEGYKCVGKDNKTVESDNSSIVNIYYKKKSFYIHFDLNGGTDGPATIYEEYETKIDSIKEPYKEGYRFIGWFKEKECLNEVDLDNLYVLEDVTYYAGYEKSDEEALVTIVFYGENANNDKYSYLGKIEKYLTIGSTYTFDENDKNEYIHHHDLSCFSVDGNAVELEKVELEGFKLLNKDLEDGYVYLRVDRRVGIDEAKYFYRYNGQFYRTDKYHISHQVGEAIRLKDHVFDDEFRLFKPAFTCGGEYEFESSDTITVHDSDNLVYVYLKRYVYTLSFGDNGYYPNDKYGTIEAKWGQMIYEPYAAISELIEENHGWTELNSRSEGVIKFMITMPKENNNYYNTYKYDGERRLNYYLKINGTYTWIYSTYWSAGTRTSESDYIDIDGYVLNYEKSIPKNGLLHQGEKTNGIYYDPKEYNLVLVSYVDESISIPIAYGTTLAKAKDYRPTPRFDYQSFAGWYLEQDCSGEEIDLETKMMPAFNLTLFAKWDRTLLNVRFIDDKTGLDKTVEVPYDYLIEDVPVIDDPDFIGWIKEDSNDLIEFDDYKVKSNINLYALYKEDTFIDYKINYLTKDGIKVSSYTTGSIINGSKIYIYPKNSKLLDEPYKDEYKPEHLIYVFEVNKENKEFDIYYVPYIKYSLTIKPKVIEGNDSIILYVNGKGFDNLEIALNKDISITGLYENENYTLSFDNGYSYTYLDIDPISIKMDEDKIIELNANKVIKDYAIKEEHNLNIFS